MPADGHMATVCGDQGRLVYGAVVVYPYAGVLFGVGTQQCLAGDAHTVAKTDALRVLQACTSLDEGVLAETSQPQAQPAAAQQQRRGTC